MKRDFDVVIRYFDGRPVKVTKDAKDVKILPDGKEEDPGDLTVGLAISDALLMAKTDPGNTKENVARYHLAKKVYEGGIQEVKTEDLDLAKKTVAVTFGPLVLGQVFDWCDADFVPPAAPASESPAAE